MKRIGFIGQGWIGKNYADDFEDRGYQVVRYSLEAEYIQNLEQIKECHIVFIAVPTPTTATGFDDSYVRSALSILAEGTTAVIKSTLALGTTKSLQQDFVDLDVFHSPEFLREKTAAHDAANPDRNIIGIPSQEPRLVKKAKVVLEVLPRASYEKIMDSDDAECVKYAGNCFLYTKVLFMNILFDMIDKSGGSWEDVREAFIHDPRIGESHTQPVHKSGHDQTNTKDLRGAGGHCFIKDYEAFRDMYEHIVGEKFGVDFLKAASEYNRSLLVASGKDLDLAESVYGDLEEWKPRTAL